MSNAILGSTDGSSPAAPIVIVDDDEPTRRLLVHYLRKLRLCNPLLQAGDGHQAIDVLSSCELAPPLVLLDLHMPRRSGLEVLAWLRADRRLREAPVVMLTGSAELEDIDRAYDLGIRSYLVKPVGFAAVADVLRKLDAPWALLPPQPGSET